MEVITSATESTHSSTVVSFFASFAIHTECNCNEGDGRGDVVRIERVHQLHPHAPRVRTHQNPELIRHPVPYFRQHRVAQQRHRRRRRAPRGGFTRVQHHERQLGASVAKSPTAYFPRNVTNGHIANALAFFPNPSLANARVARANAPALHSPPVASPQRRPVQHELRARRPPQPSLLPTPSPPSSSTLRSPRSLPDDLHAHRALSFELALERARDARRAPRTTAGAVSRSVERVAPPPPPRSPFLSSALALRTDPYATSRDDGARAIEYDAHRSTSRVARARAERAVGPVRVPRASVARDVETTTAATSATTRTRSVGIFVARRIAREARGVARGFM